MKVDTPRVRKLHTIRSQLTDMSLGTTGRQLQLQHRRWHSHGYSLPAIKFWPLDLPPKDSKDLMDVLVHILSELMDTFFSYFEGLHLQKGDPGHPWFSVPKSMSLIAILQFYKVTWRAKARKLENPSEKMMCECAAVPAYVSSVLEVTFWKQFLIFGDVVKFHVMITFYLIDRMDGVVLSVRFRLYSLVSLEQRTPFAWAELST